MNYKTQILKLVKMAVAAIKNNFDDILVLVINLITKLVNKVDLGLEKFKILAKKQKKLLTALGN